MEKPIFLQDSPSFVDLCTLHQHAMRYYRLWIYACNTVLALATLVFTVFAVSVLVDPRISLLSGVELYQPTFLYAYVALLLQCGVLQTIGCLGALRLNQKLLNAYWTLLLVLMIGDIVVGLVWAFRLDRIKSDLKDSLSKRLRLEYGHNPDFTQVWDWVQQHDMCCGVHGPSDFHHQFNESSLLFPMQNGTGGLESMTTASGPTKLLPWTCCSFISTLNDSQAEKRKSSTAATSSSSLIGEATSKRHQQNIFQPHVSNNPPPSSTSGSSVHLNNVQTNNVHTRRRGSASRRGSANQESKTDPGGGQYASPQTSGQHQQKLSQTNTMHLQHTTTESSSFASSQSQIGGFQSICELPPHLQASSSSSSTSPTATIVANSKENEPSPLHLNHPPPSQGGGLHVKSSQSTKNVESESNNVIKFGSGGGVGSLKSSEEFLTSSSTTSPVSSRSFTTQIPLHLLLEQRKLRLEDHNEGCLDKVIAWLDHVTDILFVIGFCIIVFLKGCFLAILRYEIREMIVKINLLNQDETLRSATLNELIGLTSIYEHDGSQDGDGNDAEAGRSSGQSQPGDVTSSLSGPGGSKRHSGGGGNALLAAPNVTADTSLSNSKHHHCGHHHHHHQPPTHVGNHVGGNMPEDEFDSSSALLGRVDHRLMSRGGCSLDSAIPKPTPCAPLPVPPRTLLRKNGNNNDVENRTTTATTTIPSSQQPPPTPSSMASSAP